MANLFYEHLEKQSDGTYIKEIRNKAIDEFAEKLKAELSEQIFSDEEKFKYARKEQELICAQNMTWKMAIKCVELVAEQLKEEWGMTEDIIFKEEDFTEDELMLLKMAFKLVDTVVETQRTGNSDVYLVNELYTLKEKLGVSRLVNDFY